MSLGKGDRKIIHPLPLEWRETLEKNNFKAKFFFNSLIWNLYVVLIFCYGLLNNFKKVCLFNDKYFYIL